jgi:hypothetical protein
MFVLLEEATPSYAAAAHNNMAGRLLLNSHEWEGWPLETTEVICEEGVRT